MKPVHQRIAAWRLREAGMTYAMIASELHIAERTARRWLSNGNYQHAGAPVMKRPERPKHAAAQRFALFMAAMMIVNAVIWGLVADDLLISVAVLGASVIGWTTGDLTHGDRIDAMADSSQEGER